MTVKCRDGYFHTYFTIGPARVEASENIIVGTMNEMENGKEVKFIYTTNFWEMYIENLKRRRASRFNY